MKPPYTITKKGNVKLTKTQSIPALTKKYKYYIGIDAGVNTGISVWDAEYKCFTVVCSQQIHVVMEHVKLLHEQHKGKVFVRVEDARKRKWFGNSGREQLQGAGSVKRDCSIWEDFLKDMEIDFELVAPKNNKTKLDADVFKQYTGWKERTNVHARDAAMLIFGL